MIASPQTLFGLLVVGFAFRIVVIETSNVAVAVAAVALCSLCSASVAAFLSLPSPLMTVFFRQFPSHASEAVQGSAMLDVELRKINAWSSSEL